MAGGGGALTVKYDAQRTASGVFAVMSLIATAVCVWLALQSLHEEPGAAFILSAAALLWLSVAGTVWLGITDPVRLVSGRFDEQKRRFLLEAADGTVCALPYRELETFAVRRKVSTGKHKKVTYVVYALKRDGGFWDLQSFGDDGLAAEMLRELRGSVSLSAARTDGNVTDDTTDDDAANDLPAAISREDVNGVLRFTWRNQERFMDTLCGAALGASIIALPFGIVAVMTSAYAVFDVLALLAMAWLVRHAFKARGRSFQLEIGRRLLTYSTRERGDGSFQVKNVLTVEQVTRLQSVYELSRGQQERSHQLTFVGEQDAARLQARRLADRNTESWRDARALNQELIELDLPGIRTAEVLQFEAYLQRELARRGQSVA